MVSEAVIERMTETAPMVADSVEDALEQLAEIARKRLEGV